MSENIFIAWGRNESVARAVAQRLSASGYTPTVGGIQRGSSPISFFINSNVLAQMDEASAAIILVQRIYDPKGKPTGEFRPNLMFEWGYLQRRLRADAVHAFLINLEREELPADLLNAYTEKLSLTNPAKPSQRDIETLADEIARTFLRNIAKIDFDGLEIIKHYDVYRNSLWEMAKEERAFNPREAGYYLLHLVQPAFYRNDLGFIKEFIGFYERRTSGPFTPLAMLVINILSYYDITDTLARMAPDLPEPNSTEYRSMKGIVESLETLRGSKDKIFNIFDVLLENFIGLARLRLFAIDNERSHLDRGIKAFSAALRECSQFESVYQANRGFIRQFWEFYIERNLARAYFLKGNKTQTKRYQKSAEKKRIWVRTRLKGVGVGYLANQIELEIGLSRFDEVLQVGASRANLETLVDDFLEPFKPRGIDRVWDRLHAAISLEAKRKRYRTLSSRLSDMRPPR